MRTGESEEMKKKIKIDKVSALTIAVSSIILIMVYYQTLRNEELYKHEQDKVQELQSIMSACDKCHGIMFRIKNGE